jgi:hypothetical protein
MYSRHEESTGVVPASPEQVFSWLDDQSHLTDHMSKRSWRMGWGKMETTFDPQLGQSAGSHILVRGRVFGIELSLEEVVTLREPPARKSWRTIGEPRLLVVGPYQMGFDLRSAGSGTKVHVTIDYEQPAHGFSRMLGRLFGRAYAKWCTRQMVDAARHAFAG